MLHATKYVAKYWESNQKLIQMEKKKKKTQSKDAIFFNGTCIWMKIGVIFEIEGRPENRKQKAGIIISLGLFNLRSFVSSSLE